MKELMIFLCVLMISWCVYKMMPEYNDMAQYRIHLGVLYLVILLLCMAVSFRYYNQLKIFSAIAFALIVWLIINSKDWIQLRKKNLVC